MRVAGNISLIREASSAPPMSAAPLKEFPDWMVPLWMP